MSQANDGQGAISPDELETVLERLAENRDFAAPYLRGAFGTAREKGELDASTVLARLSWLVQERIATRETHGRDPAALADVVLHPKPAVFRWILNHAPVKEDLLEQIYCAMRGCQLPADGGLPQLPDLSEERILQEMKWWIVDVGLPDYYFQTTPPEEIAHQIVVNRTFEVQGIGSESYENLKISYSSPGGVDFHWVHSQRKYLEVEQQIEQEARIPGWVCDTAVYTYEALSLYLTESHQQDVTEESFSGTVPSSFLGRVPGPTRQRYEDLWNDVRRTRSLAARQSRKEETGENRLMLGFPLGMLSRFLAGPSVLLQRHGLHFTRKYMITTGGTEPVVLMSIYSRQPFPAELPRQIAELTLCADEGVSALAWEGRLAPDVAAFADAAAAYIHQFITRHEENLRLLQKRFGDYDELREVFQSLQRRMDKDNYSHALIITTLIDHIEIVEALYALFAARFDPAAEATEADAEAMRSRIERDMQALDLPADHVHILRWALIFIESVWRTNFFLPLKSTLAFRLRPTFLEQHDFDESPFGVFFVTGRDLTGFHVRFRDIARGGIRILTCRNEDEYLRSADFLFEECFDLAHTQNKKNKDIPEGGAKGIILARYNEADPIPAEAVFRQYVDALLDLLVPAHAESIRHREEELLFLGPDEGSADLMDWACRRARERGYRYWKGFTTGKDARLGGVSHIDYGITTNGVRQYVRCLLEALDIREEDITKAQTGGPDGDLGSNEILSSKDRTTALVDGGGVLYDPQGLDRTELERLSHARADSRLFDADKLGQQGFKVTVEDSDVRLPDGTRVASGLAFRNEFHLDRRMAADLFVPCGGRPKSINGTNWERLLDDDGEPRFRWIVEGANLFLTPDARLHLERRGVVVIKDSSANKGGVISSSLEVLAGLALEDAEFEDLMAVGEDGRENSFRQAYIEAIQATIRDRARAEFEVLWRLHRQSGTPLSILSDQLSAAINAITLELQESELFEKERLRGNVLALYLPAILLEKVPMEAMVKRLPAAYQRALFARILASNLVYRHGTTPRYEEYRKHIDAIAQGARTGD